jgi:transposase
MAETRRKFDQDFKEGAVRLVRETGEPIAQVARDLGINEGTLGKYGRRGSPPTCGTPGGGELEHRRSSDARAAPGRPA